MALKEQMLAFFKTLMIVYKKQKRAENLMNSARSCFFTSFSNRFFCFF